MQQRTQCFLPAGSMPQGGMSCIHVWLHLKIHACTASGQLTLAKEDRNPPSVTATCASMHVLRPALGGMLVKQQASERCHSCEVLLVRYWQAWDQLGRRGEVRCPQAAADSYVASCVACCEPEQMLVFGPEPAKCHTPTRAALIYVHCSCPQTVRRQAQLLCAQQV